MQALSGYFGMSSDKINAAQFAVAAVYSSIMDVPHSSKGSKKSFVDASSFSLNWHINKSLALIFLGALQNPWGHPIGTQQCVVLAGFSTLTWACRCVRIAIACSRTFLPSPHAGAWPEACCLSPHGAGCCSCG